MYQRKRKIKHTRLGSTHGLLGRVIVYEPRPRRVVKIATSLLIATLRSPPSPPPKLFFSLSPRSVRTAALSIIPSFSRSHEEGTTVHRARVEEVTARILLEILLRFSRNSMDGRVRYATRGNLGKSRNRAKAETRRPPRG